MPELPDIELYVNRLGERTIGQELVHLDVYSPFVLRSAAPPTSEFIGLTVARVFRIGKRVVFEFASGRYAVIHLMISGRFVWNEGPPKAIRPKGKVQLLQMGFPSGALILQEMSTRKRASLHLVEGSENLAEFDRGGIDVFAASDDQFAGVLARKNRTLKRVLTDPSAFDGIGNAYSDEILFHARLSPVRLTGALKPEEVTRLAASCRTTLAFWRDKLASEISSFPKPKEVTAFRPDFATHGKFGQPCPVCGSPIQRIVYAENETNYCALCQNEGRLLADRSLSRLLKSDWPRTLEEMVGG